MDTTYRHVSCLQGVTQALAHGCSSHVIQIFLYGLFYSSSSSSSEVFYTPSLSIFCPLVHYQSNLLWFRFIVPWGPFHPTGQGSESMPCIRSSCSCANSERSVYGRVLDSLLKCKCNVQPTTRGHSSVNRTGLSQVESYIHSYCIRGRNAGHRNTSKKLAHSSTHNIKRNQTQACVYIHIQFPDLAETNGNFHSMICDCTFYLASKWNSSYTYKHQAPPPPPPLKKEQKKELLPTILH